MKQAGFSGYFTNHSLRVSAATRLFENGVDVTSDILNSDHISAKTISEVTAKPTVQSA